MMITTSSSSKKKSRRCKLANTATTTTISGSSNDERWLDNFNLLRKCLNPNDGSINYNLLETRDENDYNDCCNNDDCDDNDDDDDEVQVIKTRLRNFVKEQRRQYSIRCNNSGSSSSSGGGGGGGGRNSNSGGEERIRLLTLTFVRAKQLPRVSKIISMMLLTLPFAYIYASKMANLSLSLAVQCL